VNFLSVDYVKKGTGEACADEWCIGKKKKRPEQLINLVIGGREFCLHADARWDCLCAARQVQQSPSSD
jgi:hypothetical protein